MSGQGESKDPWADLARQLGEDAVRGGAGAAGEALGGWSETRPFLPSGEEKLEAPRKLGDGEEKRPRRFTREGSEAARAAKGAKEATGIVGKVLAVVAAHSFLAGAAIVVSVIAFAATGVALIKATEDKSTDEVAAGDLGVGDETGSGLPGSGSGSSDPSRDGVRGQAGDDGAGKASTPTDPPPVDAGSTTTTTRPRPTPTPTPGAPPPPDPTPEPTPQPTPTPLAAPSIDGFTRTQGQRCGDERSRPVTFAWSASNADSATLSMNGQVVAQGLPATGSYTVECVNRVGAPIGSTWDLTVHGPGGSASSDPDLRIS